jgi:predicted HicB family RNase H-like nuclease
MMTYKGYTALLEVDVPSGMLVGHVIGTQDEIVFQGKTVEEAGASFRETVDFYLRRRAESGKEPDKPFSGRFNVRIDPEMHRGLVLDAEARKISLNEVAKRAFSIYLERFAVNPLHDSTEAVADRIAAVGDRTVVARAKQAKSGGSLNRAAAKRAAGRSGG